MTEKYLHNYVSSTCSEIHLITLFTFNFSFCLFYFGDRMKRHRPRNQWNDTCHGMTDEEERRKTNRPNVYDESTNKRHDRPHQEEANFFFRFLFVFGKTRTCSICDIDRLSFSLSNRLKREQNNNRRVTNDDKYVVDRLQSFGFGLWISISISFSMACNVVVLR